LQLGQLNVRRISRNTASSARRESKEPGKKKAKMACQQYSELSFGTARYGEVRFQISEFVEET
jgi:hypothetical protein